MKKLILLCLTLWLLQSCTTKTNKDSESVTLHFSNIKSKILTNAVLAEGELHRIDSFPSKFIQPRSVDVWLPKNYSTKNKYAVLYMHDGQNLFDSTTTWNNQEWKVDEHAAKLMNTDKTKDFIVVGIHSISQIRWFDLFPEKAFNLLNKKYKDSITNAAANQNSILNFSGDKYLKFLVSELKPYIDNTYSVYSNKDNTFVAGSSMGGLMSMYAICEYPEVFKGAACISTHWEGAQPMENNPVADAIFSYLESNIPDAKSHLLYFDYGTETLDQHYPKHASRVDTIFHKHGYTDANYKNLKFEGADHSENAWNQRFDIPLTFLLHK